MECLETEQQAAVISYYAIAISNIIVKSAKKVVDPKQSKAHRNVAIDITLPPEE